jgi:hypothetical protein
MKAWLHRLPAILTLVIAALLITHGPIPQPAGYHDFADTQVWLGVPYAFDVLSNAPFALIAGLGLVALWSRRRHPALAPAWPGYALFLVALLGTALGSTWYHLAPDDTRLVWDRLPIVVASVALLAAVRADTATRASIRTWLALLVPAAIASVAWWHAGQTQAVGDLRPYLFLQLLPMLLIPLWQALARAPRADRAAFGLALALYALAKAAEVYDHQIFGWSGGFTGHNLKHLLAAGAA